MCRVAAGADDMTFCNIVTNKVEYFSRQKTTRPKHLKSMI